MSNKKRTRIEHFPAAVPAEDTEFVFQLMDALAQADAAAYERILSANDELRRKYGHLNDVYTHLREAFAKGPDLVREQFPEVMAEVDSYFDETADDALGTLTRAARTLSDDPEGLRDFFRVTSRRFLVAILQHIDRAVTESDKNRVLAHFQEEDVLDKFMAAARRDDHIRPVFIAELASILGEPALRWRLRPEELEEIVSRILEEDPVIADQFHAMETCVLQLAA
jgi:hypothetical protein